MKVRQLYSPVLLSTSFNGFSDTAKLCFNILLYYECQYCFTVISQNVSKQKLRQLQSHPTQLGRMNVTQYGLSLQRRQACLFCDTEEHNRWGLHSLAATMLQSLQPSNFCLKILRMILSQILMNMVAVFVFNTCIRHLE